MAKKKGEPKDTEGPSIEPLDAAAVVPTPDPQIPPVLPLELPAVVPTPDPQILPVLPLELPAAAAETAAAIPHSSRLRAKVGFPGTHNARPVLVEFDDPARPDDSDTVKAGKRNQAAIEATKKKLGLWQITVGPQIEFLE